MNFHLSFPIKKLTTEINYSDKLLFIGSCFAENIGTITQKYKLSSMINPHGILYNPTAITTALNRYVNNKLLNENELFYANECWNSWEHHSRYSASEKIKCLNTINKEIETAHNHLKTTKWLFITFGSAYVYALNTTKKVVGNCHKISQHEFNKSMLTVTDIVEEYSILLKTLNTYNPNLKILFTVSPVRYVRDGVIENTLSKARLIDAVHSLVNKHQNTFYFPAYELIMDDLRDYRFYKSDLVHPNEQAIEYVFNKLTDTAFSDESKQLMLKIKEIIKAFEHKPFNDNASSHLKFKKVYFEKCEQLQIKYPFLDFTNELKYFAS